MKYFSLKVGLYNIEKGIWFDNFIIKASEIPDNFELIKLLQSKYYSKVIGILNIMELQNEDSNLDIADLNEDSIRIYN